MSLRAVRLDVYRTAIPMRSFEHAAARRELAEAVVVRLELSDGRTGWGETHPRAYVTGETLDSVVADLRTVVWPALARQELRPGELPPVPDTDAAGRCLNAAACAVELAAADALLGEDDWERLGNRRASRLDKHPPADAGGSPEGRASGQPPPAGGRYRLTASRHLPIRVSGVIGSGHPARTGRHLWWMRLFGLRDFKLKLGFSSDIDRGNLAAAHRRIGKALARGRCTLRVDVNGAWSADDTPARVAELKALGVCAVEQPVFCSAAELAALAQQCELPLIADESLLTLADAQALLAARGAQKVWWNIRLSKNGGIARSLALAVLAAQHGVPFVIGCMVGEASILSAAQRRLLAICPLPRFVEGNYGRFLLWEDLARASLCFGYGGRLRRLRGPGLGAAVDSAKLARYGQQVATLGAV
jgi:L-alanine-DL-glutamate epimerase-like enolase superfamily enzyme